MMFTSFGKVLFLAAILAILACSLSAQSRQLDLSAVPNQMELRNNSDLGFEVFFRVSTLQLRSVTTKGGVFDELSIPDYGFTGEVGEPQLPMQRQLIAVPLGAELSFEVLSTSSRILDKEDSKLLHRIVPSQESVSKSTDPATVPFAFNEEVYAAGFNDREYIQINEIGFLRGVRLFELDFYPVRYDPSNHSLSVMEELILRVEFHSPDLPATAELLAKTGSYEFDSLYAKIIFNWQRDGRPSVVRYPTKMLILCPPNYVSTMQPFVDWKRQQGFNVMVTTVGSGATVANNTTAIKNYLQNLWNAATTEDPAPTYLLIVGDTSTSGDNIIANSGTTGSHVTDLTYVRLNGTDYLPEMYYGRFSVSSATELTNVINKTLQFEQTTMPDMSYLGQTILIAGVDANYAATHGNGQINYGSTHYFNASNGIVSDNYLYPASGSAAAQIIANANAGRGYINYTAHGSQTSWSNPAMTTTNLNAMTNTNKYFVAVGNCCLTNAFNYSSPCFGEVVIRAANKAGVAYIGGTNNTYWNEDYWWAVGFKTPVQANPHPYNAGTLGAYDAMFHTHGEAFTDWATTTGETIYMGNMAVQQSTSSMKNYYWEIYSLMGDPSLMPYYGVPAMNTASYPNQILIGLSSITVNADPWSRVALTLDGALHGTALVPESGTLVLPIIPFAIVGTAKLVITRQNRITIMADVQVIPNSGPYLTVSDISYADANNGVPEYAETGSFDIIIENVGSVAATNILATLTCATAGINITDSALSIPLVDAEASVAINEAFSFAIADNIAHGTLAEFTLSLAWESELWQHDFTLELNAPLLDFGSITVLDPTGNNNGRFDPGETVSLVIPLANSGGAASPAGIATLASPTLGITVNNPEVDFDPITTAGSANLVFSVTAAPDVPHGSLAEFEFTAAAGAYASSTTLLQQIGVPPYVVLGSGSTATSSTAAAPVNVSFQSLHGQSVYTAAELNAAGVFGPVAINQLGFYINGVPSLAMPNFLVRMKHTSATNAANWINATGMVTVFSAPSYQPATTGWDMLTLSTPFIWNGTDNLLIDTAFGLIGSQAQSGTVQYTYVTNGYRYARSNSADQTNVFSGAGTNNTTSTNRPNVRLGFQPDLTGPSIAVDPLLLDFGNVAVGSTSTLQFTIESSGSQSISGSIITPEGYSVSSSTRETSEFLQSATGEDRNVLMFMIPEGEARTYNLSFTPEEAIAYDGVVQINSNAVNYPSYEIILIGSGYEPQGNTAPTIDLPEAFAFDRNGSLQVDFTPYVHDPDGDPLTLEYSGNSNILIGITGLLVTFSATQNWTGNELITFTVSDGIAFASDVTSVNVNPVNLPDWEPVIYPTNPATIYGVVTIEGIPAALNDLVGAFSGDECRGTADVAINEGIAYVTLLVQLSGDRELITLQVYSHAQDQVYPVEGVFDLAFGEVLGEIDPVPINGTLLITLEAPAISQVQMTGSGLILQWGAVPNATHYQVWRSWEPYGEYSLIATLSDLQFTDPDPVERAFYYLKAIRTIPTR